MPWVSYGSAICNHQLAASVACKILAEEQGFFKPLVSCLRAAWESRVRQPDSFHPPALETEPTLHAKEAVATAPTAARFRLREWFNRFNLCLVRRRRANPGGA